MHDEPETTQPNRQQGSYQRLLESCQKRLTSQLEEVPIDQDGTM